MSLEEAIKAAKCVVDEGDMFVIDKTKFASRKRGRIASISRGNERIEARDDDDDLCEDAPKQEIKHWFEKYEQICQDLKESENELENMTKKTANYSALVKLLERKIEQLSEKGGSSSGTVTDEELHHKLKMLRRKEIFYESMTAMSVNCDNMNDEYMCTVSNGRDGLTARFKLQYKEAELVGGIIHSSDVQYEPLGNLSQLPEYLQSELSFEPKMLPVVMADVLNELYKDAPPES